MSRSYISLSYAFPYPLFDGHKSSNECFSNEAFEGTSEIRIYTAWLEVANYLSANNAMLLEVSRAFWKHLETVPRSKGFSETLEIGQSTFSKRSLVLIKSKPLEEPRLFSLMSCLFSPLSTASTSQTHTYKPNSWKNPLNKLILSLHDEGLSRNFSRKLNESKNGRCLPVFADDLKDRL